MLLNEEERHLVKMAVDKWQNKTIQGPAGTFFVSVVYMRNEGFLEALVFPDGETNGMPTTLKLLDMKHNYRILK